jgi:hypothetical protein
MLGFDFFLETSDLLAGGAVFDEYFEVISYTGSSFLSFGP